jgi:hypothetical protein
VEDIDEYDNPGEPHEGDGWIYTYLPKEEYDSLSEIEKNEKALEYYKKRNKSKWEIGRDFERYIGYKCEQQGYKVQYFGIEKKLNDLGRDLIIENNQVIKIIQCKYWSKDKIIHEKHIMQLYGSMIKYQLDNPGVTKRIEAEFITHTNLSDTAREFAKALNVRVIENVELGEYPLIKCNVNYDQYGKETRIYHLPTDQQYDRVKINPQEGDFYAFTIEEAEDAGFRRTFKWYPQ